MCQFIKHFLYFCRTMDSFSVFILLVLFMNAFMTFTSEAKVYMVLLDKASGGSSKNTKLLLRYQMICSKAQTRNLFLFIFLSVASYGMFCFTSQSNHLLNFMVGIRKKQPVSKRRWHKSMTLSLNLCYPEVPIRNCTATPISSMDLRSRCHLRSSVI